MVNYFLVYDWISSSLRLPTILLTSTTTTTTTSAMLKLDLAATTVQSLERKLKKPNKHCIKQHLYRREWLLV